ncbi:MAG: hypothetical protein ACYTEX_21555 [Planctomycetota bacterium]
MIESGFWMLDGRGAVGAVSRGARGSSAVLREAAIRFLEYYVGPQGRSK